MMDDTTRGCAAEFIGTFALCFFGCGAIMLTHGTLGAGSLVTVALAHGLALGVMVPACMVVSGSQFNPAVSVALAVGGYQSWARAAAFVLAQCVAAAAGVGMLVLIAESMGPLATAVEETRHGATLGALSLGMETTEIVDGVGVLRTESPRPIAVVGLEALLTFALMFVILTTIVDKRAPKLAGLGVGMTVAACIVGFGPLTGASMNPARSIGPAMYGHWDMHWAYWVGPIVGAIAAMVVFKVFWDAPKDEPAAD